MTESQSSNNDSRVERYLAHLDSLTGGAEATYLPAEQSGDAAPVVAAAYANLPEPAFLTIFTYGVSLANQPEWTSGKPELCMTVRSTDLRWAKALAAMGQAMRTKCPFTYGDTVDFGTPITPDTAMSQVVCFAPAVLEQDAATGIDLGDHQPVNLIGCYPIYDREAAFIQQHGLPRFWEIEWDPYDVRRACAV